ncbi:hypothetical protein IM538_14350 [Cytobacillus suaedae]|nr:hypothetical protein IM538_14350 [Cytobacillus suaedae]
MKFIQFNDKKIDSFLFMQLSDLAVTLSKVEDLEVEYAFKSYFDPIQNKLFISHFWDNRPYHDMVNGLKSDIYLRSIGSKNHSDFSEINRYISKIKNYEIQSFAKQLFMVCEDLRLEEICKRERPGTKRTFQIRRDIYRKYFRDQLNVNIQKAVYTDSLFNAVFLLLTSDSPLEDIPPINQDIDLVLPFVRNEVTKFFEVNTTKEVTRLCLNLIDTLDEVLTEDMLNMYFHLPELEYDLVESGLTFDELKRKDKLKNNDILEDVKEGDEDIHEEKLPTWHQETETTTKSFLQFDLEQGSQTNLLGEGVREGDTGDQALGMVQGSAQKTTRNDYSKLEALEGNRETKDGQSSGEYGKENKFAYTVKKDPTKPNIEEITQYENQKAIISSYQKKLKQMIQKTLEHKKNLPRGDLHFGRLNKKLIRMLTDDNPRLFYKKDQISPQIDAVFSLLVDCSASMYDKMEETKLGITLFHEALKGVSVPHQVVGFWEDTNDATATKQPNYFYHAIDYQTSLKPSSGPEIMQLQPEEDNRDGYSIRVISKKLLLRNEKQKFLLVFSDGEPAAFGYEQNGIVDTHEAVVEARKRGIEVINIFLANGEIDEGQQKTIQNIYGKFSIVVPNINELPDVLFPLLKKLLLKSI